MKKMVNRISSIILIISILFQVQVVNALDIKKELKNINENVILYEDESKRGKYEKHFICSDGTILAATYPEQVCFLDENNKWIEIDNSLEKINGRYRNKSSQLDVSFSETSTDLKAVELSNRKHSLAWNVDFNENKQRNIIKEMFVNLLNKKNLKYEIDSLNALDIVAADNIESHVTFENVCSNDVDIQYTVLPNKIKENIILNEKTELISYDMNITCDGLVAEVNAENSVEFYDELGEMQFQIQTPYMYDDVYELSYDIKIEIKTNSNGYTITFYPNQEWLNDNKRVYPITIDPTVKSGTDKTNFSDTYVYTGSTASSSRALEERLRVGIYNDKVYRVFWKIETLPTIPNNSFVNSAKIRFKLPDVTTTSRVFSIYDVKGNWESNTITWSKADSLSKTLLGNNFERDTSKNTVTFKNNNLINTVRGWYSGVANNGFMIRYKSESKTNPDYNLFYSSDNTTSTSYMPVLTVSYYVVDGLKIYQSENTYEADGNGIKPEDIKYNTKTKNELINMSYITQSDFNSVSVSERRTSFESLCELASEGDLEPVALDMIDKFMAGSGGYYSNSKLTSAAKNHSSTKEYVVLVKEQIKELMSEYNGNINKLKYDADNRENNPLRLKMDKNGILQPSFDEVDDWTNGLGICVHGLWGNLIEVKSYTCDGKSYSGVLTFTLYDHFGLDEEDIKKFGALAGFRNWYILQHYTEYNGAYKPFVTKMTFTENFSGTL